MPLRPAYLRRAHYARAGRASDLRRDKQRRVVHVPDWQLSIRAGEGGTYDFDTSDANFLSGCTPTTDSISDPQIYSLTVTGSAPLLLSTMAVSWIQAGLIPVTVGTTAVDPQWGHEYLGWRLWTCTCGESCPMNQLSLGSAQSLNETTTTLRSKMSPKA